MSTGISSLAKLGEMAEIYPFAGAEYIFAAIILGFFLLLLLKQLAMESTAHKEIISAAPLSSKEDAPLSAELAPAA